MEAESAELTAAFLQERGPDTAGVTLREPDFDAIGAICLLSFSKRTCWPVGFGAIRIVKQST